MIIESDKKDMESGTDINFRDTDGLIQFKIVYWGPGESGKTTNFMRLREKFDFIKLTNGFSIETTDGRTLWQDSLFLSFDVDLGKGMKYKIITQIITCTGQERFLSTREYVLDGADGIIFVGDSDPEKREQNKRSFRELVSFTKEYGIPYIVQLNKRDLKNAISVEEFKELLALPLMEKYDDGTYVIYPASAIQGEKVVECFQDLMGQVISKYFEVGL